MSKRYSIFVREFGADHEVLLIKCDTHPEAIAEGLKQKKAGTGKGKGIFRYDSVRIDPNPPPADNEGN
jgi:hypothetical protein